MKQFIFISLLVISCLLSSSIPRGAYSLELLLEPPKEIKDKKQSLQNLLNDLIDLQEKEQRDIENMLSESDSLYRELIYNDQSVRVKRPVSDRIKRKLSKLAVEQRRGEESLHYLVKTRRESELFLESGVDEFRGISMMPRSLFVPVKVRLENERNLVYLSINSGWYSAFLDNLAGYAAKEQERVRRVANIVTVLRGAYFDILLEINGAERSARVAEISRASLLSKISYHRDVLDRLASRIVETRAQLTEY